MSKKKQPQVFIPLCKEQAHLQRERTRTLEERLSEADREFLRQLGIES
jgi:hypothetical protein